MVYGKWQYDGGLGYGDINAVYVTIEITQYGSVEVENTYTSGIWEMEVGRAEEFSIEVTCSTSNVPQENKNKDHEAPGNK